MTEAYVDHGLNTGAVTPPATNGEVSRNGVGERKNGRARNGVRVNGSRVPTVDISTQPGPIAAAVEPSNIYSIAIPSPDIYPKNRADLVASNEAGPKSKEERRPEGTPMEPLIIDGAICERVDVVPGVVTAIRVENLMPDYWQNLIEGVMFNKGREVSFKGGVVDTSLAAPSFTTTYRVMDSVAIEKNIPFLDDFWRKQGLDIVEKLTGERLKIDAELDDEGRGYGNNINMIPSPRKLAGKKGDGYELHTDFNKWTLLVASTTINEGDGGELKLEVKDPNGPLRNKKGESVREETIRVVEGWAYMFNGKEHPHAVTKLTSEGPLFRTTLPMNYVPRDWTEKRSDLSAIYEDVADEATQAHSSNGNGNGSGSFTNGNVIDFPVPTTEPPAPTPKPSRKRRKLDKTA